MASARSFGHVLLMLGLSVSANAAQNCDQAISFDGLLNPSAPVALITERVFGECHYTNYILIPLDSADPQPVILNAEYEDTEVRAVLTSRVREHKLRYPPSEVALRQRIQIPKPSEELVSRLEAFEHKGDPRVWLDAVGLDGVNPPVTADDEPTEVIYAWPRGLYIDYAVESVHPLDEDGLLLVITRSPEPMNGADTMHGFLVVREPMGRQQRR